MAFGELFTPRDLTVISWVMTKAAHKEPDMLKRREIIGVLTKLQRSMKSRRTRAERRAHKAQAGQRQTPPLRGPSLTLYRPGEDRS